MTTIVHNKPYFDIAKKKAIVEIAVISNGQIIREYAEVDLVFDEVMLYEDRKTIKGRYANYNHIVNQLVELGYINAKGSHSPCQKKRDGNIYKCNLYFKNDLDKGEKTSNAITTVQKDNLVMVSYEPNPIVEYQLTGGKWDKTHEQSGRVYDKNGVAPTIHIMGGGNQEPKIAVEQNFIQGGTQEPVILDLTNSFGEETRVYDKYSPALRSDRSGLATNQNKRIRRLTPTEVFRLMDFEESFMDNVKKYNEANPKNSLSDSQLYKQGGNSIVVACLEKIIRNLRF